MIKDAEVAIVNASSRTLELLRRHPNITPEEIIKKVMKHVNAEQESKISAISAVTNTIKLKKIEKDLADKKIIQLIVNDYRKEDKD